MRLFCVPKDAEREKWDGPRTGIDGAVSHFRADAADDIAQLPSELYSLLSGTHKPTYVDLPKNRPAWRAAKAEKAKSLLDYFSDGSGSTPLDFLRMGRRKADADSVVDLLLSRKGRSVHPLTTQIAHLRVKKSEGELDLMRKAARISADAHAEVRLAP
jgi:Xaa-Pro aminopeptidase